MAHPETIRLPSDINAIECTVMARISRIEMIPDLTSVETIF